MKNEYCGKYLGYRHTSGAKAVCGDDVCTHIIYCKKCEKINESSRTSESPKEESE